MEPAFAHGCTGKLVLRLQQALARPPFNALDAQEANGTFGDSTRRAVRAVQAARKLQVTGTVDAALWQTIVAEAWPEHFQRALQLLGSFEGHGYTKAAGNYDGAGMTWGIAGFTIVWSEVVTDPATNKKKRVYHYNSLHECLERIFDKHSALALAALGQERADKLKKALAEAPDKLFDFAVSITDPDNAGRLVHEWQQGFAALGTYPEVQAIQDDVAREMYWNRSASIAKEFDQLGMQSEQTRQMCFELLVNPGAFTPGQRKTAQDRIAQLPAATLPAKLMVIARLFEQLAATGDKDDVRERKGTIATGYGSVHGKSYRLAGWGLDIAQPPLANGLRLAVLAFEPTQVKEQLALADSATARYVNAEAAADLREWWPAASGTELIESRSLSLRPLLAGDAAAQAGRGGDALANAIAMTFEQPVGILALFGQSGGLGADRELVFGRGARGYAGLEIRDDGQLRLFHKRGADRDGADRQGIDIGDIRPALAHCRLVLLYCGNGVPAAAGERGAGTLLRQALAGVGGHPLVLGWFGNAAVPKDGAGQFVAPGFFAAISKIAPGKTLEQLCRDHERAIIQAWGAACYKAFGLTGQQRILWLDGPFVGVKSLPEALRRIGLSGAGAIGTDGTLWQARDGYQGSGDAMTEVRKT